MTALQAVSDLMTFDQAAELLKERDLTREELMQAARSQSLTHIQRGRRRWTTEAWILEWLQARVDAWEAWVAAGREGGVAQTGIYFVVGAEWVKIGYSRSPVARLTHLQQASPYELRIVLVLPGGIEREPEVHARFAEQRERGEWFRLEGALREFLESVDD